MRFHKKVSWEMERYGVWRATRGQVTQRTGDPRQVIQDRLPVQLIQGQLTQRTGDPRTGDPRTGDSRTGDPKDR